LSGPCDFAAVRAAILEVARRREGPDGIPVLIDFRGTPFVPSSIEAIELADVIAQPDGLLDHRVALVAADEAQLRVVSVIVRSARCAAAKHVVSATVMSRWAGCAERRSLHRTFTVRAARLSRLRGRLGA
jgi:hypothetical protein